MKRQYRVKTGIVAPKRIRVEDAVSAASVPQRPKREPLTAWEKIERLAQDMPGWTPNEDRPLTLNLGVPPPRCTTTPPCGTCWYCDVWKVQHS